MNALLRNFYTGSQAPVSDQSSSPSFIMATDERQVKIEEEIVQMLEGKIPGQFTTLTARSIRIGTYKSVNKEKLVFVDKAIRIIVPSIHDPNDMVTLILPKTDIVRIQAHFGKPTPVLFIFASPSCCERVRTCLKMTKESRIWFDISVEDMAMRNITVLLEKISEDCKDMLQRLYGDIIEKVDEKQANEILIKSAPKPQQDQRQQTNSTVRLTENQVAEKYCQFPLTGINKVDVTTEDYTKLEDETFINDGIIDFYLNWLLFDQLSEEERNRTHIFSTFFYRRLVTKPRMPKKKPHPVESDDNLSAAQKRYARVKRWTKSVNLFAKDFVVVPINEDLHWFVAVICFPGLVGCRDIETDKPCDIPNRQAAAVKKQKVRKAESEGNHSNIQFGSSLPSNNGFGTSFEDPLSSDGLEERDEASGSEDDMIDDDKNLVRIPKNVLRKFMGSPSDEDDKKSGDGVSNRGLLSEVRSKFKKTRNKDEDQMTTQIKQPCILVFDSLRIGSRSKVVATLREYLECEYHEKIGKDRVFTNETFPGCSPRVPQQPNFYDCGIFVLQYVESFFKNPIKDYCLPIQSLQRWFTRQETRTKRSEIAKLIRELAAKQFPGKKFNFPELSFHSASGYGYTTSEDDTSDEINDEFEYEKSTGITADGDTAAILYKSDADDDKSKSKIATKTPEESTIVFVKNSDATDTSFTNNSANVLVPRITKEKNPAKVDSSKEESSDNLKPVLSTTKSVDNNIVVATLQKNIVTKTTATLKRSIVEKLSEKLECETLSKLSDSKKFKCDNF